MGEDAPAAEEKPPAAEEKPAEAAATAPGTALSSAIHLHHIHAPLSLCNVLAFSVLYDILCLKSKMSIDVDAYAERGIRMLQMRQILQQQQSESPRAL